MTNIITKPTLQARFSENFALLLGELFAANKVRFSERQEATGKKLVPQALWISFKYWVNWNIQQKIICWHQSSLYNLWYV